VLQHRLKCRLIKYLYDNVLLEKLIFDITSVSGNMHSGQHVE
jgi:hypothetical protein